jgi:heme transporter
MRDAMAEFADCLGRHLRAVELSWLVVVIAALPFASDQTSELTGGGFDVPGSGSKAASDAIERHFPSSSDGLAVVLRASPIAGAADRTASVGRVERAAAELEHL